ncbi:MAG: low affinity iron permease family protein [Bacteroidia bacterium]
MFNKVSSKEAPPAGSPISSISAFLIVFMWLIFKYSDTWLLIINPDTIIITFIRVFVIQQSQNKDTITIAKLNELLVKKKQVTDWFALKF